jgi:hypothetical protein
MFAIVTQSRLGGEVAVVAWRQPYQSLLTAWMAIEEVADSWHDVPVTRETTPSGIVLTSARGTGNIMAWTIVPAELVGPEVRRTLS